MMMRTDIDICECGDLRSEHLDNGGCLGACGNCAGFQFDFGHPENEVFDDDCQ